MTDKSAIKIMTRLMGENIIVHMPRTGVTELKGRKILVKDRCEVVVGK